MKNAKNNKPKLPWSKPTVKTVTREELKKIVATSACSQLTFPDCPLLFR